MTTTPTPDPSAAPPPDPADAGRTFEDVVAELEAVTEALAAGQVGIEEAADLYERAEHLHLVARRKLDAVAARVERLTPPPGAEGGTG